MGVCGGMGLCVRDCYYSGDSGSLIQKLKQRLTEVAKEQGDFMQKQGHSISRSYWMTEAT